MAELLRHDVVTADLDDVVADIVARVDASAYGFALVTAPGGVLLGRLRRAALQGNPTATAEQVMEPGPSTIRPDTGPAALARRLRDRGLTTTVVTDPDGVLLGIVKLNNLNNLDKHEP